MYTIMIISVLNSNNRLTNIFINSKFVDKYLFLQLRWRINEQNYAKAVFIKYL